MATSELYGVNAELIQSIASTPVSTDTTIIFIGACASGDLNKPYIITSFSDYATKLGGAKGDGYNLTEAALAAFSIANINKVIMIPVSHSTTITAADYIGDASALTGVYAIEAMLAKQPTAVNLICAPGVSDSTVLSAIKDICIKADGHWSSFMLYDVPTANGQINAAGVAQVDEIVSAKNLSHEQASAVWGNVKIDGNYVVSGAAVRACLMAKSDASYGVPARTGGNLQVTSTQELVINSSDEITNTCVGQGGTRYTLTFTLTQEGYTDYNGVLYCSAVVGTMTGDVSKSDYVTFANGVGTMDFAAGSSISQPAITTHKVFIDSVKPIYIPEPIATQLSADGICSFVNYSGTFYTWGDHTSAFTNGTVSDERARFDNSIRMLLMLTNRFQMKYRTTVDAPMTLQMRNDVINEELDNLASLVAIGAIIGEPACSFEAIDNPTDSVAQGQFTWRIQATPTIPFKYGNMKVAYSQAGLSVYTA